ncbi:hypothetical protein [Sphingopyxis yananensis]|uniref:hypothetical protein n=1 Tax=Sphingopyxis yananensis TaxID=2886687 RepID=UPI001D10394A|nr:hypothetical protein [Sphingopyxis yananensis]MCC2601864.1 hypothetical protein [Sphingopyxis yananensis]
MASTFEQGVWRRCSARVPAARSLGKRMSIHAALSLIAFSIWEIWLVSLALDRGYSAALWIVALLMVAALAVPITLMMDRRWDNYSRQALASSGLHDRFRRDVRLLWAGAFCVPFLWLAPMTFAGDAIAAMLH